jgi:hypothetical protein
MAHDREQTGEQDAEGSKPGGPILGGADFIVGNQKELSITIQDPKVPAMTMPVMLSLPVLWARMAAGGMTSSLGRGRIELSIAINRTMRG